MRFGFDTGYFVKYAAGTLNDKHRHALQAVATDTAMGFASAIVTYELKKLGLKGVLDKADAEWLVETVGHACEIDRVLTDDYLDEAARLSHGNDLSMADAMILATALRNDADRIYTTDTDLLTYEGSIEVVRI
jgi:predicted nucleic acid-binding protein